MVRNAQRVDASTRPVRFLGYSIPALAIAWWPGEREEHEHAFMEVATRAIDVPETIIPLPATALDVMRWLGVEGRHR